eukprot:gb/GEZN01007730.1/.p1 GENE.gb/GEZN01007730.1/~~gb/GEZN01007730.1/.p1  ORF type:complete len:335 (-),score=26.99 gb/GEZN01007730.1/:504-1379(-)
MATYLSFPELRSVAFRLVYYMAIADALYSLGGFFGLPEDGTFLCYLQATLLEFPSLASNLWATLIAYTLYLSIVTGVHDPSNTVSLLIPKYHALAWGVSGTLTLLPFTTLSYGDTGSWCYIKNGKTGNIWRFITFYIPIWIMIGYVSFVYFKVWRKLNEESAEEETTDRARMVNRLKYYPAVLVVCYTFGTVNRIYNVFHPKQPIFGLQVLHLVGARSRGFLNAMVYGFNPLVRHAVFGALSECSQSLRCCWKASMSAGYEEEVEEEAEKDPGGDNRPLANQGASDEEPVA